MHLHSDLSLKNSLLNIYPSHTLVPQDSCTYQEYTENFRDQLLSTFPMPNSFHPNVAILLQVRLHLPALTYRWNGKESQDTKMQLSFQANICYCASTTFLAYLILVSLPRVGKGSQTLALANSQGASQCQHDKSKHSFTSAVNTGAGTFPETLTGSSFIPCRQKRLATSLHIFQPCTLILAST